ncbi:MAG TPA: TraB/GumN family protein [Allosphingosinicella sp.]|jgi:hypothetical protein
MGFKSLTFSGALKLLPLALLAAAPAASATPGKDSSAKAAWAEPRPALWLLADEDTRIYMLGTIHVLPPGFRWRSAAVDRAVGESSELVVETYLPPGTQLQLGDMTGFFLDPPVPLVDRVPMDKRKGLQAAIAASGLPGEVLDRMHSWAAAMTLGIAQVLGAYGVDDPAEAPGVEDALEADFRRAGKPILSVEKGDSVFAALAALPEPVQAQLLVEAIAPPPDPKAAPPLPAEELDWVAGRDQAMDLEGIAGFPPALFDVLIRRRNAAWTEWLEARMKKPGTLLFAVGAGHLAGRESVQAMLARRGLRVSRVD